MSEKSPKRLFFPCKAIATNQATDYNGVSVIRENFRKHLALFLDSKPNFFDHINENIKKATKGILTSSERSTCHYHCLF